MITKTYSTTGPSCRVTFEIPAHETHAHAAAVLGQWNDWNPTVHPMERREDGALHLTLDLPTGHHFRFRYLLDGEHWLNDSQADGYELNQYGTHDSILALDAVATQPAAKKAVRKPAAPRAAAASKAAAKPAVKAPVAKAPAAKSATKAAAKAPAAAKPAAPAAPATPAKAAKPAAPRKPAAPKGKESR